MRRLILGVALLAVIVGAAALGFAAGGHATSKRPSRTIDLHWGDHVIAPAIKVSCSYGQGPHQQRPHLLCFGPRLKGDKFSDPELLIDWTRGVVQVDRCWGDCVRKKEHLFTARR